MIKEILSFNAIESDNAPDMQCNMCGKEANAKGWLLAAIYPFMNNTCDFSIVVCSKKCKDDYLTHPVADFHILDTICRISFDPNTGGLNAAYASMVDSFNNLKGNDV